MLAFIDGKSYASNELLVTEMSHQVPENVEPESPELLTPLDDKLDFFGEVIDSSICRGDMDLVLDAGIVCIEELFHANTPTQWIRQQGFHLIKMVLKGTYGQQISLFLEKLVTKSKSNTFMSKRLHKLTESIWPNRTAFDSNRMQQEFTDAQIEAELNNLLTMKSSSLDLRLHKHTSDTISTLMKVMGRECISVGISRATRMINNADIQMGLVCRIFECFVLHLLHEH